MEVRLRRLLREAPAGSDRQRRAPGAVTLRIAVIGNRSGKTTVAAALAKKLGAPHVELDALHHGPGWAAAPADELRERVRAAIAGEA